MTRLTLLIGASSLALIPLACGDSEKETGAHASGGTSGNGGRQGGGAGSGGSSQGGGAGRAEAGEGGTSPGGAASGGTSSAGEGGTPDGSGGAGEGGTPGGAGGGEGGAPTTGGGGNAGAGGNAGSGGVGGNAGSGGVGANAGVGGSGGASGSGGSAGGSSGAGNGGMAGMAGAAGVCNDSTPRHLAGSVSGNAFSLAVSGGGSFFRNMPLPQLWDIRSRLGSDGLIHLAGPGSLLPTGTQGTGTAHWMMPSEGPSAGIHFCADVEIANVTTFRRSARLTNFSVLGACPSVPGNGSLSGCFGLVAPNPLPFACSDDQARLVGDIQGDDIDASYEINTDNVAPAGETARFLSFGDRGVIALYGTAEDSSGFIQFPFDGVNPGLVYCIDSAAITPDGTDYTFTLDGLSLLGSCPATQAVSGEATGCL